MDGRKWFLLIFLAIAVFVGLVGYGDFRKIGIHLAEFPYPFLAAAFTLACANFALRFVRWAYYLKVLELRPPLSVSILVFLSGLAMAITPGKAGSFTSATCFGTGRAYPCQHRCLWWLWSGLRIWCPWS